MCVCVCFGVFCCFWLSCRQWDNIFRENKARHSSAVSPCPNIGMHTPTRTHIYIRMFLEIINKPRLVLFFFCVCLFHILLYCVYRYRKSKQTCKQKKGKPPCCIHSSILLWGLKVCNGFGFFVCVSVFTLILWELVKLIYSMKRFWFYCWCCCKHKMSKVVDFIE